MAGRKVLIFTIFLTAIFTMPLFANSKFVYLGENSTNEKVFIGKFPTIVCNDSTINYEKILAVLLDETDITSGVKISENTLSFKPFFPLPSGTHTFSIIYKSNGEEIRKDYQFSTKQSEQFDTAMTKFSATTTYVYTAKKSDDMGSVPYHLVESDPTFSMLLENPNTMISTNLALKYFNQSEEIPEPQRRGFDLSSYLMTLKLYNEQSSLEFNVGDIQITESDYSAQGLSARGGKTTFTYDGFTLSAFVMDAQQRYGFTGGMGLDIGSDNSIYGASVSQTLFKDTTTIKFIAIKGKKTGEGFGSSSPTPENITREGEVYGFVLTAPLFTEKISLYSELNFSNYDPDANDNYTGVQDKAYNIKISATPNEIYQIDLMYNYIGREYYSIANEWLTNDTEGLYLNTSANFQNHSLAINLSGTRNNVDKIPLYSRIYTYSAELQYSLLKFQKVPFNLSIKREWMKSTDEPTPTDKQDLVTDYYHADIGYNSDKFYTSFSVDYSLQNDKLDNNTDSSTVTYSLMASYFTDNFHIDPNISYNVTDVDETDTRTESTTLGLSLGGSLFDKRINYDFTSSYTITKDNKDTVDTRNLNSSAQITYTWKTKQEWILKDPYIGVRGEYNKTKDKINDTTTESYLIQMFVTIPIEYIM